MNATYWELLIPKEPTREDRSMTFQVGYIYGINWHTFKCVYEVVKIDKVYPSVVIDIHVLAGTFTAFKERFEVGSEVATKSIEIRGKITRLELVLESLKENTIV